MSFWAELTSGSGLLSGILDKASSAARHAGEVVQHAREAIETASLDRLQQEGDRVPQPHDIDLTYITERVIGAVRDSCARRDGAACAAASRAVRAPQSWASRVAERATRTTRTLAASPRSSSTTTAATT